MIDPDTPSWILWVLGTIVSAVGGCFGFSMVRISQVETHLRVDMAEEFDAMRVERDSRLDVMSRTHERMWAEMARMNTQSEEHRARVADRLGQLPTRDEMKSDLAAMERRIETMFRSDTRH